MITSKERNGDAFLRGSRSTRRPAIYLKCAASLAVVALYSSWIRRPYIWYDDFDLLTKSRTWSEALAHVWQTLNDHAMPLARLAAGAMMYFVPAQSSLPRAIEIEEVLAVILGMWVLYALVRRELGHPLYGCIAMTLFGVTSAYYECVTVYSSSFFVLALDTLLLALLSAQAFRQAGGRTSKRLHLLLCSVWCVIALAWHSSGIFAGIVCALYLLPFPLARGKVETNRPGWRARLSSLWPASVPLLGSAFFMAVSLPRTASQIVHAPHYQGQTIFQRSDLAAGLANTVRSLAASLSCHLPRCVRAQASYPEQVTVLKLVQHVDEVCRDAGIDGVTARAALGFLQFPESYAGDNAWEFLRGSPSPTPMSVADARSRLGR